MAGFESARAEAMKTCGAELQGESNGEKFGTSTESAFNSAKKNIEGKMGFIDRKLGGVDKQFDKVTNALQKSGHAACGQVLDALQGSFKGEIVMNAPKQVAAAPATAPKQETAGLSNIAAYAGGTVRAKQLKEMGLD